MIETMKRVLGVDAATVGSRKGWAVVAAVWDGRRLGPPSAPVFVERLGELLAEPGLVAVGIDIPIGLAVRGWRGADLAGRRALGRRSSTLFPVAPRPAVEEADYDRAKHLAEELTGKRVSRQSHGLRKRILELDVLLREWPEGPTWYEVHPELSFAALAGEVLAEPKSTWAGLERRRALLARAGMLPAPGADTGLAADDVLDAAAALWSAGRALAGTARRFVRCPEDCPSCGGGRCPTHDPELGRQLAIHA